jgi:hypothetical protein
MFSAHEIATLLVARSMPGNLDIDSVDLHSLECRGLLLVNRESATRADIEISLSARTIVERLSVDQFPGRIRDRDRTSGHCV